MVRVGDQRGQQAQCFQAGPCRRRTEAPPWVSGSRRPLEPCGGKTGRGGHRGTFWKSAVPGADAIVLVGRTEERSEARSPSRPPERGARRFTSPTGGAASEGPLLQ